MLSYNNKLHINFTRHAITIFCHIRAFHPRSGPQLGMRFLNVSRFLRYFTRRLSIYHMSCRHYKASHYEPEKQFGLINNEILSFTKRITSPWWASCIIHVLLVRNNFIKIPEDVLRRLDPVLFCDWPCDDDT